MTYSLWDIETNNLVAEFQTEREVLKLVLHGVRRNGPHDADSLSLDVEDERGETITVACGRELAELAIREFGSPLGPD